jgi:photosystem II stability/assembly factor-like uncharacterized protein
MAEPKPGGRIYAGTTHYSFGATVRVTDDFGKEWVQLEGRPHYPPETGWQLKKIWQLTPGHASEPDTVWAGVDEAGLFVSRDRGMSWSEVSSLTRDHNRNKWFPGNGGLCLHTILIDPRNKDRMWVGISAVGAFRTEDGGKSWKNLNKTLPQLPTGSDDGAVCCCVHKMVNDPRDAGTMYMQYHGGVFKSTDAGDNWAPIESGLPGNFGFPMVITRRGELLVAPLGSDENRVMKDGRLQVYKSSDGGASWKPSGNGLPTDPQYVSVLRDAMAVDALDTPGVYFGTTTGEVYASADGGANWSKLPGQLPRINTVKTCVM